MTNDNKNKTQSTALGLQNAGQIYISFPGQPNGLFVIFLHGSIIWAPKFTSWGFFTFFIDFDLIKIYPEVDPEYSPRPTECWSAFFSH